MFPIFSCIKYTYILNLTDFNISNRFAKCRNIFYWFLADFADYKTRVVVNHWIMLIRPLEIRVRYGTDRRPIRNPGTVRYWSEYISVVWFLRKPTLGNRDFKIIYNFRFLYIDRQRHPKNMQLQRRPQTLKVCFSLSLSTPY